MKKYMTTENAICIISIIFTLFVTNNTLFFGTNIHSFFDTFSTILSCLFAAGLTAFTFLRKKTFSKLPFLVLITLTALLSFSALINLDFRFGYIFKVALLFFGWSIVENVSLKKFAFLFDWVITVLAAFSLLSTVLYILIPRLFHIFPSFQNISGLEFKNVGLAFIPTFYSNPIFTSSFPRNFGIFREPGVYQMYLSVAIMFQLFVFKKPNYWKIGLFALVILSTLSTVGILSLGIFLILWFLRIRKQFSLKTQMILLGSALIVLIFVLLLPGVFPTFYSILISKWSLGGASAASSVSRYASILANLIICLIHPVFGAGISGVHADFPVWTEKIFGVPSSSNANSVFIQFSSHGLFFGLIWLLGFIKGAFALGKNRIERILLLIIVLFLLMTQNYSYSLIFYLFFFYCVHAKKPLITNSKFNKLNGTIESPLKTLKHQLIKRNTL